MAGGSRTLTIKFVGDSKSTTRAIKDIVSGLDDTESAGKRVSTAMKQLSDDAERDLLDAKDAADKLAQALGPETVSKMEAAGRSVDGYIEDLRRMGLSFDDVRTDVDELADAIRKVETTKSSIDSLKAPLNDVDTGLRDVRSSSDQSGSVLANMVGNSVQDLGALGGVAGTAGMALGQLAEYATEGNISLSGLAKVAGPMVGVGVAVMGVSWAIGKLKENSEKAREAGEGMLEVQEQLRDGNFEDAASKLQQEWGGTIRVLTDMGFTTQQVIGHLTGQADITADLEAKVRAHRDTLADNLVEQQRYDAEIIKLRDNLGLATTAFAEQGVALQDTTTQTNAIESALGVLIDTAGDTSGAIADVDRSAQDFTEEMIRAKDATKDLDDQYKLLSGALSDEALWLNLQLDMQKFRDDLRDSGLSADEKRLKVVEMKQGLIDYMTEIGNIPAEKQTEILALIDSGDIAAAEAALSNLTRPRSVPINANVIAPGGRYIPGGSNIVGATGGIVTRPTQALIGEAGPEAVIPLDSVPGNMPLSSLGPGALGGQVINVFITQHVPPATDLAAVGRASIEAILAAQRQSGAVFQMVRG